jgi:signal transduction histidine kinase
MEMGTLELRRKRAPLSELMDRAIESARPFAKERGHQLLVSVSSEPIYLQMDVLRLSQALHNLITNACKYTDKQGQICLRAQRNGAGVSIVVSDRGIGIPAARLDSIFCLFTRAGQADQSQAGLGIGLYLARCFVEAHGGTVTAASAGVNRGSEFTIEVPCEPSTAMVPSPVGEERAGDRFPV